MDKKSSVHLMYFAYFREMTGLSEEDLTIEKGENGRTLFYRVVEKYGIKAQISHFRLAVNEEFVSFDQELRVGDQVAFIPPVAGG